MEYDLTRFINKTSLIIAFEYCNLWENKSQVLFPDLYLLLFVFINATARKSERSEERAGVTSDSAIGIYDKV